MAVDRPGDQKQLRQKLEVADNVLCELEHPKNAELRGRPQKDRLLRIQEFIESDPIYLQREARFGGLYAGNQEAMAECYRDEVFARLRTFESLTNKNPELEVDSRLGSDYRWVYRKLAREVYYQFQRDENYPGDSIFRLQPFSERSEPPQEEEIVDFRKAPEESALLKVEPTALEQALGGFFKGETASYRDLADLGIKMRGQQSLTQGERALVADLTDEHKEILARCIELVTQCEVLQDNPNGLTFKKESELCRLIHSFEQRPYSGLSGYPTLEYLELEGTLSSESGERLKAVSDILADMHPATIRFLENYKRSTIPLPNRDIESLDKHVRELARYWDNQQHFEREVKQRAQDGWDIVSHLGNLAFLARKGLKIQEARILNIKNTQQNVVAGVVEEVKKGVYQECNGVLNLKEMTNVLQRRLQDSRSVKPHIQRTVNDIMQAQMKEARPEQRRKMEEFLLAVGDVISEEPDVRRKLSSACEDARTVCSVRADISQLRDLINSPTRNLEPRRMLQWLGDLSTICEDGIQGVDQHVRAAHTVWERERRGDATQSLVGFVVEARSVLELQNKGFKIEAISQVHERPYFEFDMTGIAPDGKPCVIEVKQSLQAIHRKDRENIEETQPFRFLAAAKACGKKPLLAISSYRRDELNHFSPGISYLFDRLQEQGFERPQIYNILTGSYMSF